MWEKFCGQLTARTRLQLAEVVDVLGEVSAVFLRRPLQLLLFLPDLTTRADLRSNDEGEGCGRQCYSYENIAMPEVPRPAEGQRPFKMPSTTFDRHLRGNGWGMRRQRVLRCVRWCVLRRSRCRMRSAGCGSWTVWKVRARPTRSRLVEEVVALRSQAELMLARVDSPEVDQGRSAPVRLIRLRLCPSASPAGWAAMSGWPSPWRSRALCRG